MKKAAIFILLVFTIVLFQGAAEAAYVCTKDLNGNGKIELDTERWECRGANAAWSCPYGAVECVTQTSKFSGQVTATLTGVAGKNAICGVAANSGNREITFSSWKCEPGAVSCSCEALGGIKVSYGNMSGSVVVDTVSKIVGNGDKLDVYGCTGTSTCAGGGAKVGSITVSGATFAGTATANAGIISVTASADGGQISTTGYSCVTGGGCSQVSSGVITLSGTARTCPSGVQYGCVQDTSDGKYKCSTETCFDDTAQGMVGPAGEICVSDMNGNGIIDIETEVGQCANVGDKKFCPLQATDCTPATVDAYCLNDGTQCANGGTWKADSKRCEVAMSAASYMCYTKNIQYSTLGECQDQCKNTMACTSPEVVVSGAVDFAQEGFNTVSGGDNALTLGAGGKSGVININGCSFSGSVSAASGVVLNRIKVNSSKILAVYEEGNIAEPKGTISITGCLADGEIYSPAGQGLTGVSGAQKTVTGMWQSSQFSNGSSITFSVDPAAGTGCPLGPSFVCTNGFCSEGGDCGPVLGCPAGYAKLGAEEKCVGQASGATFTPTFVSGSDRCEMGMTPTCPDGYAYDQASNMCRMTPICPDGGTLNTVLDKCQAETSKFCPTGYTYDPALDKCLKDAGCENGGTYNSTTKKCELADTPGCDAGYAYNDVLKICQTTPTCPQGDFNAALDKCVVSALTLCPAPYGYDSGLDVCTLPPPCPGGSTYSASVDKCTATASFSCPSGTAWNEGSGKCEAAASSDCAVGSTWNAGLSKCQSAAGCPTGGSLNGSVDACQQSTNPTCPTGYTFNASRATCERLPVCAGGAYNATLNACTTGYSSITCPGGVGSYNGGTGYCEIAGTPYLYCDTTRPGCEESWMGSNHTCCTGWLACSPAGECDATGYTCPGGYTWTGSVCRGTPTFNCSVGSWYPAYGQCLWTASCPGGGTLNGTYDVCQLNQMTCATGYTWNSARGKCEASPSCSIGSYSSAADSCLSDKVVSCPTGTTYNAGAGLCQGDRLTTCDLSGFAYEAGVNMCTQVVSCPSAGILNASRDQCEITLGTGNCPSGFTFDAANDACLKDPDCMAGSTYSAANDMCEKTASHVCASGYAWDQTAGMCQSSPGCTDGGVFDTTLNKCYLNGAQVCPSGQAFVSATDMCEIAPPCTSSGVYAAERDFCELAAVVSCPAGYTWEAASSSCVSAPACTTGTYDNTLKKCKGNVMCPYGDSYQCLVSPLNSALQCSPNACANLGSSTDDKKADLKGYTNDGTHGSSGCQGVVYIFNGKGGECRPKGFSTWLMDCCDEKEDKLFVIKERCEDDEYRVAVQKNKKYCHEVGEYCKKKWSVADRVGAWISTSGFPWVLPFGDCLQTAKTYCCFSGKLARIIHEQGRPQLNTSIKDWGMPETPNCRGFTTDEFAMLDFSKMNLSEYFAEVIEKVQATVQQTATAVSSRVNDYFNNTLKKN